MGNITRKEAKIKALSIIGGYADCFINDLPLELSNADRKVIAAQIDIVCNAILREAKKLKKQQK